MKSRPDKSQRGPLRSGHLPGAESKGRIPCSRGSRRLWFRVIALLSPFLLLGAVEVGLRLGGYGYSTSFFLEANQDGREIFVENPKFGWRFFPPRLARSPQPISIFSRKQPDTIRIFVLGESAAMGDPEPAFGFARQLERLLRLRHPNRPIEVLNVAMTAINSHVMREIANDCARREGDCWIVYAGNNEVVGPYGAGTVFGRQAPPLAVVRLALWLKRTRLGQVLANIRRQRELPEHWEGMEMFIRQQVARDDLRLSRVYKNFAANLQATLQSGRRARASVLLTTVPVNLKDCPPFGSQHRAGLTVDQTREWDRRFAAGREAEEQRRFADALKAYGQAMEIDSEYAELVFRMAVCEAAQAQTAAARKDFESARELDTLRFRADARLNDTIRRAAQLNQVQLVDAEQQLGKLAGTEIAGEEIFYDHVHLNFKGNYLLACLLVPVVERELFEASQESSAPLLSEAEVTRQLSFTDFERQRVFEEMRARLRQPPFSSQSNFKERDERWGQALEGLNSASECLPEYGEALAQWPNDWMLHAHYARALEAAGDSFGAALRWQQVARLMPHEPEAWFQLGNLAYSRQNYAEAERLFREVLRRNPESVEGLNGLGLSAFARGDTYEAKQRLESALKMDPSFAAARINLAMLLAKTGDTAGAITQYRTVLSLASNNVPARIDLAQLLMNQGKTSDAISLLKEAIEVNPEEPVAQYNLANALSAQQQYGEAIPHYYAAVKARPEFAEARYNLGLDLARVGRIKEALEQFAQVVRLKPDFADAHFNYGIALARQKRYPEAVRELRETLRLQPQHAEAEKALQRALMLADQQKAQGNQ